MQYIRYLNIYRSDMSTVSRLSRQEKRVQIKVGLNFISFHNIYLYSASINLH